MKTETEVQKTSIGVYCKCGGIIYCCTDAVYSRGNGKKEVDRYFNKGFQVGKVSHEDIKLLFGCKCKPELY